MHDFLHSSTSACIFSNKKPSFLQNEPRVHLRVGSDDLIRGPGQQPQLREFLDILMDIFVIAAQSGCQRPDIADLMAANIMQEVQPLRRQRREQVSRSRNVIFVSSIASPRSARCQASAKRRPISSGLPIWIFKWSLIVHINGR